MARTGMGLVAVLVGAAVLGGCSAEVGGDASSGSAEAAPAVGVASERAAADAAESPPIGSVDRSLVRTGQVRIEVEDTAAATDAVRAAAAAAGGFVAQERSGGDGAYLVLRIPAAALDGVLEQVSGLGTVTDRGTTVVDATEEVVDLDARVASQQASVARVRALLAEATSIGDVVAIESELARREADLDSLTSRLAALRDQVALSTLTVDLQGPDALPGGPGDEPPGFLDGLAAGWSGLLALGTGFAAVLGFLLPFVPVLAVLGVVVWVLARAARRRRAAPSA